MKNNKKWIAVALALVLLMTACRSKGVDMENAITMYDLTTLQKEDYIEHITENGEVVSENSTTIYPELPGKITEVNVEVGDVVEKGQIIGRIDDSEIVKSIQQSRISMAESARSRSLQIEAAQNNLNRMLRDKKEGIDSNLTSAEQAAQRALDAWRTAERDYEEYRKSIDEGYSNEIIGEIKGLAGLENALTVAQEALAKHHREMTDIRTEIDKNVAEAHRKQDEAWAEKNKIDGNNSNSNINQELQSQSAQVQSQLSRVQLERQIALNTFYNNHGYFYDQLEKKDIPPEMKPEVDKIRALQTKIDELDAKVNELEIYIGLGAADTEDIQQSEAKAVALEGEAEALFTQVETSRKALEKLERETPVYKRAVEDAYKDLELNKKTEERAEVAREQKLIQMAEAAGEAEKTYNQTLQNIEVAEINQDDQIKDLRRNLKEARSGNNRLESLNLKHLQDQREKAVIKAPFGGTITDVKMVVGESPEGFIAKIETIDQTLVHSTVTEYDINKVHPGMPVEITANSLGTDEIFRGTVAAVYPIPDAGGSLGASMSQDGGGDNKGVTYKSIISFDKDVPPTIHPGMNVRVKYITYEEKNILQVPSTAIIDEGTTKKIYILDANADMTKGTVKEMEVNVTKENEFNSIISAPGLKPGLHVINEPMMYTVGQELDIVDTGDTSPDDMADID